MLMLDTAPLKREPVTIPCSGGVYCRVCAIGPAIAREAAREAQTLREHGYELQAARRQASADWWTIRVARCRAGVL